VEADILSLFRKVSVQKTATLIQWAHGCRGRPLFFVHSVSDCALVSRHRPQHGLNMMEDPIPLVQT
jgi:hypothetical protein